MRFTRLTHSLEGYIYHNLLNPSLEEAHDAVKESLTRTLLLTLIGLCQVSYQGRASSELDWGDRLIVIKPDGSVLIHQSQGYEPVNWQPPGSIINTQLSEGYLVIKAIRRKPAEELIIRFTKVYALTSAKLFDTSKIEMHLTEEELRQVILENPHLVEEGLRPVAKEWGDFSGFIDIFCRDKNGNLVVLELKNEVADQQAVSQLYRYVSSIKKVSPLVRGIIVAPRITKEARRLLMTLGLEFKQENLSKCSSLLQKSKDSQSKLL
ncbi:MAG: endonuclease NucS [Candidatus Methanomethylicota archaeon]|uniref:Endonuclease NucS n=1 Tax=Thermoproteota archaeon TaxID=2056631 RepID=A0A497F354_9CREN|nr:MAG: endonuclease NucS [Candidatus Verstraetearchaeota archaeon]